MPFRWMRRVCCALALAGAGLGATALPAEAQLSNPALAGQTEARAQQAALFERLRAEPDNLDLMAEYARLSIQLEDYEAAISTLERMLIYRQDLPTVRRELGVAYFNIGSYEAAKLYLNQVLQDDTLPLAVRSNTEAYLAEIDRRTRINRITQAQANAGVIYATNATLGPELIETGAGTNTPLSGGEEESAGIRLSGSLVHDYDLQGANSDFWRTEVSGLGIRYFDTPEGNLEFVRLRTGPRLSLNDEDFGPKLRPYFALQHLSVDDRSVYLQGGLGIQFRDAISPRLSSFADVSVQFRNFTDNLDEGSDILRATAEVGMAFIPARDLVFRGALILEQELATGPDSQFADDNTNTEIGARFSAEYDYEPGLAQIDSKWTAAWVMDFRGRFFPYNQRALGLPRSRTDFDVSAGISHVFGISQNFGVQADVLSLLRASNIETFDLDNVTFGLSALYRL